MQLTSRTLLSLLFISGLATAQTVYRTIDEAGNVAYTDRPPLQVNADRETVETLSLVVSQPKRVIAAPADEAADANEVQAGADALKTEQAMLDRERQAQLNEQRSSNCNTARDRLVKYSQARRIYRDIGDGEREYLSDTELDAEREHAARAVDEWCDG